MSRYPVQKKSLRKKAFCSCGGIYQQYILMSQCLTKEWERLKQLGCEFKEKDRQKMQVTYLDTDSIFFNHTASIFTQLLVVLSYHHDFQLFGGKRCGCSPHLQKTLLGHNSSDRLTTFLKVYFKRPSIFISFLHIPIRAQGVRGSL